MLKIVSIIFISALSASAFATKSPKIDLEKLKNNCLNNEVLSDCYSLGYLAEKQDKVADAKKYYELVCRGGSWATCVTLGKLEQRSGDKKTAAKWFGFSCNDSSSKGDGCYHQALIAQSLQASSATVDKLFSKACKKGFKKAC